MAVDINTFTLNPLDFQFQSGKKPQALRIEWKESFSHPRPNSGYYNLEISKDADVKLFSVHIPGMNIDITINDFETFRHKAPYLLNFTPTSLIWYEDTESYNERYLEVHVIVTRGQSKEEACEVVLTIQDNYVPGTEPEMTLTASAGKMIYYQ